MHRSPRLSLLALVAAAGLACGAPAPTPEAAKSADVPAAPAPAPADGWTFDFKDPGPGPRAPQTAAFGAAVGVSMFPEVEALVKQRGLDCADTSVRAMMDRRREAEKAKVADAKARGEDAVTSASWVNKRSKREANPQLRFSCPKITGEQIGDRPRPPSTGRLLYVFDDASYPLRHSSYQRTHRDHAAALLDFEDTAAALTAIYGPPSKSPKTELPRPDANGKLEFPNATNYEIAWNFADLAVRVNVLRYGDLVTVGERLEVPHGIRPDAPKLSGTPTAPPTPAPPATSPPATSPPTAAPSPTAPPATPPVSAAPTTPRPPVAAPTPTPTPAPTPTPTPAPTTAPTTTPTPAPGK